MTVRRWPVSASPLPEEDFRRRHLGLLGLLTVHLIALPIFGVLMGWSVASSLIVVAPAAALLIPAALPYGGRTFRATCCVLGLLCCSGALVWLWHGQTEAHFHYFVIVGAVALYEAWLPYAIAFVFVVLQHGLMSVWMPGRVYGSMQAMQHPWLYAGIHGGFIAALAVANLVSMRASQRTRSRETVAVERSLASSRRLERAFAGAPNGAALLDDEGIILTANEALARSLRTDAADLEGRCWTELIHATGSESVPVSWPPASPGVDRERCIRRGDGSDGWLLVTYSRLGDELAPEWVVQTLDITRRRDAETNLEFQATHDTLTGLLNRHTFVAHAQARLSERASDICVLFVDVDDFKIINDSLGHDAGDELLVAVADRLRSVIRQDDLIGRFGGDEFVVCLAEPSPDDADATAGRVTDAFTETFPIVGVERIVTASVGLAFARTDENSMDALLRDADLAMYEAKAHGKARHTWFDVEMRERAIDRLELEADLRDAITHQRLEPYYQPQVTPEGRLVGFEALARWQHPTRGPISPGVFIPIAEHSGLVSQIGAYMLRAACDQAVRWADADPEMAQLSISVNVSPRCICNEQLPALVAGILRDTQVSPERVCLEVTESAIVERTDRTDRVIRELKALGVRISIDDFGVGHSSLAQLTRLTSLDELKIDKALIDSVAVNPAARSIVGSVVDIAIATGLNIVAEGVEDQDQLRALTELGCLMIQGFLFARPLPAEEFLAWHLHRTALITATDRVTPVTTSAA